MVAARSASAEDLAMADAPAESEERKVESEEDEEALLARAQKLMDKVLHTLENPNPKLLHALASMLETQESRYLEESTASSFNNARSSHTIAKLANLVQDNDDFYDAISSKFLSENRYSVAVRASSARLILSLTSSCIYPQVFDDVVLDNIKTWLTDDNLVTSDGCIQKGGFGDDMPTESELLTTYATGILAIALANDGSGGPLVEDILTSDLSAKFMRYLRTQVLGDAYPGQKNATYPAESARHGSVSTHVRGREENRLRSRECSDPCLEVPRVADQGMSDDLYVNQDCERGTRQVDSGKYWSGDPLKSELTDSSTMVGGAYEVAEENDDLTEWQDKNLLDGRSKYAERLIAARSVRDEDPESLRDDLSKRRIIKGLQRSRTKTKVTEGNSDTDRILTSPDSGLRVGGNGRIGRDRNFLIHEESKKSVDIKNLSNRLDCEGLVSGEEKDDRLMDCIIGSKDISEIVKKAIGAAEAEARAANAPPEAIKAAGDAAAELVKTAAVESWENTNDEEAAISAATAAACTVVDAAIATEISRNECQIDENLMASKDTEVEEDEQPLDIIILDKQILSRLRQKYCIQCLETLGEYVEAFGPILHEKGVDVCFALLQKSFEEKPSRLVLLPEVLKLICALGAHRKFAALFVDRGGMQKLLSVPRDLQTYFGLSSCLFTIGSLQGIMERVCALPSDVVGKVVELALQLLLCPQEQARKNAAIFFAAAFVFRAVLDAFGAQDGLQKMLNLLHGAATVRMGGNSSTPVISDTVLRNDRAEVLSALEKQIAYHTCIALRQYFRAHLLLLVDSLRPNKSNKTMARNAPSARAAYKPLDISNESMDAVFLQIQRDRKLGHAFVKVRWPPVDKFLANNGHITMLELCQAPPVERYLHDLAQYALGVLHIVTFIPYSRKSIISATLSNNRFGMAVILDAANGAGFVDPEVIHPALNVLVNLVCPPPSFSNKFSASAQVHQSASVQVERVPLPIQNESRERNGESNLVERSNTTVSGGGSLVPASPSGVVGDRRISLGSGFGCAGLASQLEQCYHQAREAVRANNGIKVLLHLLQPRMITPPAALDCIRALACRVLLGLARDDAIAHILTKLQVGKKLSELIRDLGGQAGGIEQGRWQSELTQVAVELIAIVTHSGRASTIAATDAAAPTLRRIERAAIAAATPITYHRRELLLLIHEHLQRSGLTATANLLQKEADLASFPGLGILALPLHQTSLQEAPSVLLQWPSGRASCGFHSEMKMTERNEDIGLKPNVPLIAAKKRQLTFPANLSQGKSNILLRSSSNKSSSVLNVHTASDGTETPSPPAFKSTVDVEIPNKTPILLPLKRKFNDLKDPSSPPAKHLRIAVHGSQNEINQISTSAQKNLQPLDHTVVSSHANSNLHDRLSKLASGSCHSDNLDDIHYHNSCGVSTTPVAALALPTEQQPGNVERTTLDSLIVQYLKHQHRQCPAPITTLPPLSLLQPHVCPEPSRSLNAPTNITARVSSREFKKQYGSIHAQRRDRQFVYSRFRPFRSCRDGTTLTSITYLGDSYHIASGSDSGDLKIFDTITGNVLESQTCHQTPVMLVKSASSGGNQLILSSGLNEVKLWDASSISAGPLHSFEGCKAACFSHSGTNFAALSSDSLPREVLLYDVQTYSAELRLTENSNNYSGIVRGHAQSLVHFSPLDTLLLWNGVLWDRRSSSSIKRFEQFTDYGGGGFHPAGNEIIINSEVWDLRKFKLLRTVPSLDQTVITFNGGGDVIYATLRRNLEDITSAINPRRVRHPLFPAFRTIDAVNYTDIATVQVDRCILDFATDNTDTFVGVIAIDDHDDAVSSARLFEIGRRKPTDDDSDPEDGGETDDDDEENDESDADVDAILEAEFDAGEDSDSEGSSNDEEEDDVDSADELDEDADFNIENEEEQGLLEFIAEGDEDGDEDYGVAGESLSSGDEGDFAF